MYFIGLTPSTIPDYHEEEADNRFRAGRIRESLQLDYLS
jgi:hypothetical protein